MNLDRDHRATAEQLLQIADDDRAPELMIRLLKEAFVQGGGTPDKLFEFEVSIRNELTTIRRRLEAKRINGQS